ncbi:MAG: hypothetical protein U0840_27420 [Gemmataceae bacterium]
MVYGTVPEQQRGNILAELARQTPVADLTPLSRPGSLRWKPLTTRGEMAANSAPYVVDTLTIPYDNPYHALFFTSGHDFLPDGRIAVCTAHGDVWLVAADEKLQRITWRRFATGLYHPRPSR